MSFTDTRIGAATTLPAATTDLGVPYVQWSAVIAGAIAASALALVLETFAAAVGLAVSSTAPTWRDASMALWILSGLYMILVALASYGLGGYIAGRMRTRLAAVPEEVEVRDGGHGLLVWALATLLTALLALAAAQSATRLTAPSGGTAGPSTSVAGANIIAYDLDKLFRSDRRPAEGDFAYNRSEASRILLTSAGHTGVTADDRTYLIRLVTARTGLAGADAERRVDTAIANAHDDITRARRSTVILAFMLGAAALLGAAAAWLAACVGGRHRDDATVAPSLLWGWRGPRTVVRRPQVLP